MIQVKNVACCVLLSTVVNKNENGSKERKSIASSPACLKSKEVVSRGPLFRGPLSCYHVSLSLDIICFTPPPPRFFPLAPSSTKRSYILDIFWYTPLANSGNLNDSMIRAYHFFTNPPMMFQSVVNLNQRLCYLSSENISSSLPHCHLLLIQNPATMVPETKAFSLHYTYKWYHFFHHS